MQAFTARLVAACLAACAGLADGAPESATLPGVRPVRADPLVPAAVAAPATAAVLASVPVLAPIPVSAPLPRPGDVAAGPGQAAATAAERDPSAVAAPARSCEEALHLPWGPIDSCRSAVVAGALGTGAAVSALAWWDQGLGSSFSTASEGWFGKGTYAGVIDKLGHAYSFYLATRLGTRALAWARVPQDEARRLAAAVSLGFGLGVEVFDGLSAIGHDNPLRYLEVVAGYGAKGFRSDFDYSEVSQGPVTGDRHIASTRRMPGRDLAHACGAHPDRVARRREPFACLGRQLRTIGDGP